MLLNYLEPEILIRHKDQVMGWMSMVSGIVSWQGKRFFPFPNHPEQPWDLPSVIRS
jgi:hypothetical protein